MYTVRHGTLKRINIGIILAIVLLSTLLGLTACGPGAEKLGEWYGGDVLVGRVTALQRKADILVLSPDSQQDDLKFLRVTPQEGQEFVVAYIEVRNDKTSMMVLTLDSEAVEIDSRESSANSYFPIDVFARGVETDQFVEGETYYDSILWGDYDLEKGYQLTGWMVFEVPKGETFRQLAWRASDTIFIQF